MRTYYTVEVRTREGGIYVWRTAYIRGLAAWSSLKAARVAKQFMQKAVAGKVVILKHTAEEVE